jgi:RimJ/RimL family protein N-acetyltransferase
MSEEYWRQSRANFFARKDANFVISLRQGGELIGGAGFPKIVWGVPWVEIGYWVSSRHTKKGYATEAVRGLIAYAFERIGAVRVEIHMNAENTASEKVALKVGCQFEGLMRRDSVDNLGNYRNTKVYAILKPLP